LGPFVLADYRPGASVVLRRNPNYWKVENGRRLPYLDSIRLDILANRDMQVLKLRRGEIDMADSLDAETFERLQRQPGLSVRDAGPTTDVEMLWFNQANGAPLPKHKAEWFRLRAFRQAVSQSINRADLVRVVYKGYAEPAAGPVPKGSAWFNNRLRPHTYDPAAARKTLQAAGFRLEGDRLRDSHGNLVSFTLITNAGNKIRARMAALIQQDLQAVGIRINIVTLDFASILERIGRTFDYDACLLGLVNVEPDPSGQMNIWLSSGANHPWNPAQKSPATSWEAEIDGLMRLQAASAEFHARKKAFDRVQEIASIEVPIIYLSNRHALTAVSASLLNVSPSPYRPHLHWNVERISTRPVKGNGTTTAAR
jgi:peptide/nickel transport system substrate-binding protein